MSGMTQSDKKELDKLMYDIGYVLAMAMEDNGLKEFIEADYEYNGSKYKLKFTKEK